MVDAHCHLDEFEDLEQVLLRAWEKGLEAIMTVAAEPKAFRISIQIASKDPRIFLSLGIHPHYAKEASKEALSMLGFFASSSPKVRAIGETGLDFYKNLSPRDKQEWLFKAHIELAHKLGLPLVIHCRNAFEEVLKILDTEAIPPQGVMVHCFSGSLTEAEEFLKRGFFISFAGNLTYPNADRLREAASAVPEDKVLLETDAPFLAPQPFRGKRNEPSYVEETFKTWAKLKGLLLEEAKRKILSNFKRFFLSNGGGRWNNGMWSL